LPASLSAFTETVVAEKLAEEIEKIKHVSLLAERGLRGSTRCQFLVYLDYIIHLFQDIVKGHF